MFLDKSEFYSKDGWPSEQEKRLIVQCSETENNIKLIYISLCYSLYIKTIQESPIDENLLAKICQIGLNSNLSLAASHAIDLVDQILKKVVQACVDGKFLNGNTLNMFNYK